MSSEIRVALAGNPNAGKTSLFNRLTGARAHVGNYPGVTVEKREAALAYPRPGARGRARGARPARTLRFVDLPGTYSLSATSPEEMVARDVLLHDMPDVVVQVVDATNLERNLYLATQLKELGARVVYALNMADLAASRGLAIDVKTLAQRLGGPVVPTVGTRGGGLDDLLDAVVETADAGEKPAPFAPHWGEAVEAAIAGVARRLPAEEPALAARYPVRWLAARLVEGELDLTERLASPALRAALDEAAARVARAEGRAPMIAMAEARYGWIAGACAGVVESLEESRDRSEAIDRILCHRVLGLPIFAGLMLAMFHLVFTLGNPPMDWIDHGTNALKAWVSELWPKAADSALRSLLVDGVIAGVGGVVMFLPNIVLLFLAIAFLEDTGYLARAAFLMDRLMRQVGLQGRSFIPMLLGFGCTVPGVMAARTLDNRRDRLTTILVLPLMSCGARVPVYALLAPAFFPPQWRGPVVWSMYVIGVAVALAGAKALRSTLFKGESVPFVMELPPYRLPAFRNVLLHMGDRASAYLRKAGTTILAASVLMWALATYPKKPEGRMSRDYAAAREAADRAYVEGARALGLEAKGAAFGDFLARAAAFDLADAALRGEHWGWELDGPRAAEAKAVADRGAALDADAAYGPTLAAMRGEMERRAGEDAAFAEAAAGLAADGDDYRALRKDLDGRRAARREANPEAVDLAARFGGEVRVPHDEARGRLARDRAAEAWRYSVTGRIGRALEPVVRPMGFDWRVAAALIGSFAAKEAFVAQMGIVFSLDAEEGGESDGLRGILRDHYTRTQAYAMMLYCLLSLPCVATIAVVRREAGGWKWALGMMAGLTALAYVVTTLFYQTATAIAG